MDFSVIENHPWATAAVVGIGGLGLYLLLRGNGGGDSGGGGGTVVYAGGGQPSDAQVAANASMVNIQSAANVRVSELSATLAGLGVQSDRDIQLAKIAAGVQNYGTWAALSGATHQTDAELTYGLSAQDTAVQLARIQAGAQTRAIDTLTTGATGTQQSSLRLTVPTPEPVYSQPAQTTTMVQTPAWNGDWPTREDYGLDPNGGGYHCAPTDSACVARQNSASNAYVADVAAAQTSNNLAGLIANYQISIDAGVISPTQMAEYKRLTGAA